MYICGMNGIVVPSLTQIYITSFRTHTHAMQSRQNKQTTHKRNTRSIHFIHNSNVSGTPRNYLETWISLRFHAMWVDGFLSVPKSTNFGLEDCSQKNWQFFIEFTKVRLPSRRNLIWRKISLDSSCQTQTTDSNWISGYFERMNRL